MSDNGQRDASAAVGKEKSSRRVVVFTPRDEERFSTLLRETWPTIRFTCGGRPDHARKRDEVWIEPEEKWLDPYPRFGSLAESSEYETRIWIEPPDWTPDWRPYKVWTDTPGVAEVRFRIRNLPASFSYFRDKGGAHRAVRLPSSQISTLWDDRDIAHAKAVSKFWRLLTRFASNRVDVAYDDTGAVRAENVAGPWIGPDAADWCRSGPGRRLHILLRPTGSPAGPLPESFRVALNCEHPGQMYDT